METNELKLHTLAAYLAACRQPTPIRLAQELSYPPSSNELREVLTYLTQQDADPIVVGSLATLLHLDIDPEEVPYCFRGTSDADIFVQSIPPLLDGWRRDRSALGVTSWISPKGGRVDLILAGQEYPGGDPAPDEIGFISLMGINYADFVSLLKMKLATPREKDTFDAIALIRRTSRMPSEAALGPLSPLQQENWDMVKRWLQMRPQGRYGE